MKKLKMIFAMCVLFTLSMSANVVVKVETVTVPIEPSDYETNKKNLYISIRNKMEEQYTKISDVEIVIDTTKFVENIYIQNFNEDNINERITITKNNIVSIFEKLPKDYLTYLQINQPVSDFIIAINIIGTTKKIKTTYLIDTTFIVDDIKDYKMPYDSIINNYGTYIHTIGDSIFTYHIAKGTSLSNQNLTTKILRIYPNPVVDNFTIEGLSKSETLNVFDLNGRVVLTQTISNNEMISVTNLSKGMYFIKVGGEIGKILKK
jgi:hypothetical protein